MEKHGIVALGRSVYEAETVAEVLGDLALAHLIIYTTRNGVRLQGSNMLKNIILSYVNSSSI